MTERLTEEDLDQMHAMGMEEGDAALLAAVEEIRALRRDFEATKAVEEQDVPVREDRLAPGDLPAWNDAPLSDDELNFLRGFVRSMVVGGHDNIATTLSHVENEIVRLRSEVSFLRQDRREAWLRNAKLVAKLTYYDVTVEEELVAP